MCCPLLNVASEPNKKFWFLILLKAPPVKSLLVWSDTAERCIMCHRTQLVCILQSDECLYCSYLCNRGREQKTEVRTTGAIKRIRTDGLITSRLSFLNYNTEGCVFIPDGNLWLSFNYYKYFKQIPFKTHNF